MRINITYLHTHTRVLFQWKCIHRLYLGDFVYIGEIRDVEYGLVILVMDFKDIKK